MAEKTVFCVQAYGLSGARPVRGKLSQYGTASEAMAEGAAQSIRHAGVLVFSVRGEPDFGSWDEPRVLARYGAAPLLHLG
jgi:hypothetical protein